MTDIRSGYRVPAPSAADRFDWPADFGQRFTVFVDTEEEFDWSQPVSRNARGTEAMRAMPATHARFADRGVPMTFLVDHPIVTCPHSVDILHRILEDGVSAIGTQLHPWVNPPFDEDNTQYNSFTGNLPTPLQEAKLDILHDAITRAFGRPPKIYRAGRYGIGPETMRLLAERGYAYDSSMRAGYSYAGECGPDFSAIGNDPFRTGPGGAIVEIPYTTVHIGRLRRGGAGLFDAVGRVPRARGAFSRLGLLSRVSLTPEDMPLAAALEAIRVAVGDGLGLLNFAFHSPSVAPGYTPYVRDAADLAAFHRWWDAALDLLDRLGVRPAGEADLLSAAGHPPVLAERSATP
ncbi:polysaccharide deacetylase family protein [Sphingomonas japonica]|uniref:WalW protein n=1 Tax=Sphingomonas japonica TaxID=511662 RepID=A0ABX0TZD1_9SPHN|nr:polysaccharide deacetylase family protein [Sphingomonas japonica]NIJ22522.1 hypothetical protein [Sphingomonas japonica]